MPAFNEAKTITETINRVVSLNFVNQLVIVDDGSTDGTRQILNDLNHEKIKINNVADLHDTDFVSPSSDQSPIYW